MKELIEEIIREIESKNHQRMRVTYNKNQYSKDIKIHNQNHHN